MPYPPIEEKLNPPDKIQKRIFYYGGILLIATEIFLIGYTDYAFRNYLCIGMGRYISLDVFYCLPIIQIARLAAIHAAHSSDSIRSTFSGVIVALVWSAVETINFWPNFPMQAFALNAFTRSVVFIMIGGVVAKLWREREFARKDMLTGLANRVELMEKLEIEQDRSARSGRPYSLLFIDIDKFKVLNDIHGHRVGDFALKIVADILKENSRKVDVPARHGGDEFVLLLPDTDAASGENLIKRIEESARQAFELRFWPISVSIGRATETGMAHKADWVIRLADESMYQAKRMKQQIMDGAATQLSA